MTAVKICGITSIEDALHAVECGAEYIGLNFYAASPRCVTPERAAEIAKTIEAGANIVGIFVNASAASICRVATEIGLDLVQVHGAYEPNELESLNVIRAIPASRSLKASDFAGCDNVLLDTASPAFGGSGKTFDWSIARELRGSIKTLFLAGGLNAENVEQAIHAVEPDVVDIASGVESAPGRKDPLKVSAFIQAVRLADHRKVCSAR